MSMDNAEVDGVDFRHFRPTTDRAPEMAASTTRRRAPISKNGPSPTPSARTNTTSTARAPSLTTSTSTPRKNPADRASKQGVKITIDETAKWNGQSMLRTELIPETKAAINKGKAYYHFSVKTAAKNASTTTNEHQIAFFESHFTELKYGASGSSNKNLQWHVGGVSKWDVELVADEWHNVPYEIDFDAGQVSFYHSTGSEALTKTAGPFMTITLSNGADWHLGVLRLLGSNDGTGAEDWFFSGVYVESRELTTSVGSGGSASATASSAAPASSAATSA